jgi:hypothetical protein
MGFHEAACIFRSPYDLETIRRLSEVRLVMDGLTGAAAGSDPSVT